MKIQELEQNPLEVPTKILHLKKLFGFSGIEFFEPKNIVLPDEGSSTDGVSNLKFLIPTPQPISSRPELEKVLVESLKEIFKECSEANWDGYNAIPISYSTYLEAEKVIRSLPLSLPIPEIVPEPTGRIGLEWRSRNQFIFVISVGSNNIITYAGIFGEGGETHGTESFDGSLSPALIINIQRIF